jgi:hypothetical protein
MGLNPVIYWMDVSDASYYIFNDKGNKGSQMGHTKKIFKKKNSFGVVLNQQKWIKTKY